MQKAENSDVKKFIFKNKTSLNKDDILQSYENSTMFEKNKLQLVKDKIKNLKKNRFVFYKNTCLVEIKKK